MGIALIILAALLGVAAAGSALQKLRRDARVMGVMRSVGVKDSQVPVLAILELLGAAGLLVGIWVPVLGLLAAAGLALYFLGAVIAHLRAKAPFQEAVPALVLALLAIVVTVLQALR